MKQYFKLFPFLVCSILIAALSSCTNGSDEEELITQPVTNNPLIVPNYGSGLPGLGANDHPN